MSYLALFQFFVLLKLQKEYPDVTIFCYFWVAAFQTKELVHKQSKAS